jgi:IPT/TIG domain-containing protein
MSKRLAIALLTCGLAAACSEDPKLKVTGIEPATGDTEGGSYVVIKGNRFINDGPRTAVVYFGTKRGTVSRFANDHEMTVQAPAGKAGEVVDVEIIFEPGGRKKLEKAFTYVEKGGGPSIDDLGGSKKKNK